MKLKKLLKVYKGGIQKPDTKIEAMKPESYLLTSKDVMKLKPTYKQTLNAKESKVCIFN